MDELRSVFAWLIASGQGIRALQLATDLGGWWNTRGNPHEGHRMYGAAFAAAEDIPNTMRFEAIRDYSWLLALSGEIPQALALRDEIRQLARTLDDPLPAVKAEQVLGALAFIEGNFDEGRAHTQRAIELAEDAQLAAKFGGLFFNMATLSEIAGDYDQARAYHQRGLELFERDKKRGLYSMHQMGLASLALRAGDWLEADRLARDVWADIAEIRDQQVIMGALLVKSEVYLKAGDPVRAARLMGAADQRMATFGRVLTEFEIVEVNRLRDGLTQALTDELFQQEGESGRSMTLDALTTEMERSVQARVTPAQSVPSVLHSARGRGCPLAGRRQDQSRHCRRALHLGAHRPIPRWQHHGQARRQFPHRRRRPRRARPPPSDPLS